MLVRNPMKYKIIYYTFFSVLLLFVCLTHSLQAQEKRVGLATYDVVSGESVDYLKKAVREALMASLKEKGAVTIVVIDQTEEEIKKRGVSKVMKSEKVEAIVTGSIVKLGAPVQVNTRVYGAAGEDPALVSVGVESLDKLLPTLKGHSQLILEQLNRSAPPVPVIVEQKQEIKKKEVASPPPPPAPVVKETVIEEKITKEEIKVSPPKGSKAEKAEIQKTEIKEVVKEVVKESAVSFPDYKWMSERLPFEGRGMAYDDLNGDGKKELIFIDLNHVYVYDLSGRQLKLLHTYQGKGDDHFVRVYTLDVTGDGRPEVLVSNIRNANASSLGLRYDSTGMQPLFQNSPWMIKVVPWDGRATLVGESYFGETVDYHDIKKLKLEGEKLVEVEKLNLPREIGIYGLSDFRLSPQEPGGVLYLTPSGSLKIYEDENGKYKKRWSSSERYGGTSNWINQKVRNMFNEVDDSKTYINIDPVAWTNGSGKGEVMVAKNDTFLKNVIGTRPIVKNCSLVKLEWHELGLRETFATRKIDGYVADNLRAQLPGEKSPQLLSLLWLRDPGFASTMGTFKSVLAVYDLN